MWWVVLGVIAFVVYEEVGEVVKAQDQAHNDWVNKGPWHPEVYRQGQYVTYQGKTWRATTMTLSTDTPGGTSHWVEVA